MVKRKKRLERGIKSLERQINLHLEKRKRAVEEGKIELAEYYSGEIERFQKDKAKKKGYMRK
jgi:hypothetical protein